MAELFDLTFASALTGAGAFDSVTNTDSDMTWVNGTSPDGSTGYVNVVVDDTTANYGLKDHTAATTFLRIAFWVDFTNIAISSDNDDFRVITLMSGASSYSRLQIRRVSGALKLVHGGYNDVLAAPTEDIIALTSLPDWIEWRIERSTDNATADGNYYLYFGGGTYGSGGTLVSTIANINNYDSGFPTSRVRLGATNISASISGNYDFDRVRLRNDDTAILFVENSAPTVADPGTLYAGQNDDLVFGTDITIADVDSNMATERFQCSGSGTVTVTLSGSATISAGANGSGDLTVSGTNAELLTIHDTATYNTAVVGNETVTVTVTDDAAASDSQAFTITTAYGVLEGTQAEIQAMINAVLSIQNTVEESCTVTVTATDGSSQSAQAECVVTFANAAPVNTGSVVNPTIAAIRKGNLIRDMRRNPMRWRR